jgi:single-strand DNA-binding protein
MSGVNKAILLGNIGKDPEIRTFQDGDRVANFSLATSTKWKDKVTGEQKEAVEWHNISAFGKLAAICEQYLNKGDKVYIEGHIKTEKYTDKEGVVRYSTKIIMDNMQMLSSFKGDVRSDGEDSTLPSSSKLSTNTFDDDIPF